MLRFDVKNSPHARERLVCMLLLRMAGYIFGMLTLEVYLHVILSLHAIFAHGRLNFWHANARGIFAWPIEFLAC